MAQSDPSRRKFLASSGTAAVGAALTAAHMAPSLQATPAGKRLPIYIFSKHLQWLDYEAFAKTAKTIGYDGAEVTLRSGGHVEPERAADDLPRFVEACKKHDIAIDLACTNIKDANNKLDQNVMRTMAENGIKYYRLNGWRWDFDKDIHQQLREIKPAVRDIVALSKELGLKAAYQNHSGAQYVGSAVWDIYELIHDLDTEHIGYSFDIGHATIEGGYNWVNSARVALPLAKSLVIKDFLWTHTEDRGWRAAWCSLGDGMIDAPKYFDMVAKSDYRGPIMMHFEYPTPGNTHVNWYKAHIKDQQKDVATLKKWLQQANLY
jgi:L-ribulose-5-phosphate 3-epimerase